jgi:retron-type reverse transcriptase
VSAPSGILAPRNPTITTNPTQPDHTTDPQPPHPPAEEHYEVTVPAVRDRIVQSAGKIVLEPIFEADMLDCSFGFRPKRAAHDALQVLVDEAWRGRRWVVETDIANCFPRFHTTS